MAIGAQRAGEGLAGGVADRRIGVQAGRGGVDAAQVGEVADEVGQQGRVDHLVAVFADETQLARPVKGDLLYRRFFREGAVPGPPAIVIEAVAARAGIGEGRVDEGMAPSLQLGADTAEGELPGIQVGETLPLRDLALAGLALDLGEDRQLLVGIDQGLQNRRLEIGVRNQPDRRLLGNRRDAQAHTPPRSAST